MNEYPRSSIDAAGSSVDSAVASFFRRVYMWMAVGLAVTGGVAFAVASSPGVWPLVFGKPQFYLILFAPLIVVFGMSYLQDRISAATATGLFMLLSVLYGLTFSAIFLVYTGGSIARAFFISGGMFAALSAYGFLTRRNLSAMGQLFFMGVIGLIIASVVNMFLASDALSWAISVVTVIVFAGLTAYDTQTLRAFAVANARDLGGEVSNKVAVLGALNLYISFINLFMAILRLTGDRRR